MSSLKKQCLDMHVIMQVNHLHKKHKSILQRQKINNNFSIHASEISKYKLSCYTIPFLNQSNDTKEKKFFFSLFKGIESTSTNQRVKYSFQTRRHISAVWLRGQTSLRHVVQLSCPLPSVFSCCSQCNPHQSHCN